MVADARGRNSRTRARRLAWHLAVEAKLTAGDRVAIAVENHTEHLETFYATLKLGCVPVNVDVRHRADGIHDVLDHSDAKAVVYSAERSKAVKTAAKRIQKPWRPLLLSTGVPYEHALASAPPATEWRPDATSANDLIVIYTGGTIDPTTAVVMAQRRPAHRTGRLSPALGSHTGATALPVVSLTHTIGLFPALEALISGGAVALVTVDPLEPAAVWNAVEQHDVAVLSVASEPPARHLTDALSREPMRWDLRGLRRVVASVPLAEDTRHELSERLPTTEIVTPAPVARTVGERFRVVDDVTGLDVEPGSGAIGALAVGGAIPVGYFKDSSKTAAQFRTIEGARFWLSGEQATVDAHGVIENAAAGATTIVIDGQPVSVPLIERILCKHASVSECLVVGVPDVRSGERLIALVQVVEQPLSRRSRDSGVVPIAAPCAGDAQPVPVRPGRPTDRRPPVGPPNGDRDPRARVAR